MGPELAIPLEPVFYKNLSTGKIYPTIEQIEALAPEIPIEPISPSFDIELKPIRYTPWKWNRVLGWKRHTITRPRKRLLVRFIKQGLVLKGRC